MNEPGPISSDDRDLTKPVFVSYATADRKEALSVCKAMERRGTDCWISCRDVPPGENYQEAIVRAIRRARAMVLVFSEAANNSDEIKKELSLASKHHVAVMALRIEDVEPSDAFAYELSTRQWIDAFESWDRSIDSLVRHIKQASPTDLAPTSQEAPAAAPLRRAVPTARRNLVVASAVALLLVLAGAGWWLLRPTAAAPHSMMVRLTGFSKLSPELPAGMTDAIHDEVIAAFNDDGVVGVSTASAPPEGDAPAYALGGTVRRDGDHIKVNVRLTNERSGATLWTNIFSYDVADAARIPRHVGVDAGNMVRCGLFAASTYRKALPDPVLTDYLSFCHKSGFVQFEPGKALDLARKVVAAAPDFSWGWSAVASGAWLNTFDDPIGPRADELRSQASEAVDKALALDKTNSEAWMGKALLLDPRDFVGQEKLFRAAIGARPLACGCEHHIYGEMLQSVGRTADAADEYSRSTDVLALNSDSQMALAEALILQGRPDEAKPHLDAAIDLTSDPTAKDQIAILEAPITGDYPAAVKALGSPKLTIPGPLRDALQAAATAMVSGDSAAKARAVQMLMALPADKRRRMVTSYVAALGANREALELVAYNLEHRRWNATSWLFMPNMAGAIRDPSFPALARKLGLMRYWKTTHTKPDICSAQGAPPFCGMI